jgi:hypothetical protein
MVSRHRDLPAVSVRGEALGVPVERIGDSTGTLSTL